MWALLGQKFGMFCLLVVIQFPNVGNHVQNFLFRFLDMTKQLFTLFVIPGACLAVRHSKAYMMA